MATSDGLTVKHLYDLRDNLHDLLRQARFSRFSAAPAEREYFRGLGAGYQHALDNLDDLLADVVVVALVVPEGGDLANG